ncbi:MAG: zinc ribbon domain-containing protein [Bacilli bacterium]|nr:zinc ribbon domain-containing protein [Bacilli bacterium]
MEYNMENFDINGFLESFGSNGTVNGSEIPQGVINFVVGFFIVFAIIVVICAILILIAQIMMFKKGKQPGWAAIIPFYNQVVQCKMVGISPWWVLIVFLGGMLGEIPHIGSYISLVISVYFMIILGVSTARAFGKSDSFAVGLILLPVVFYPVLGFGKAEYVGNSNPMNDVVFKKAQEILKTNSNSNKKFCSQCGAEMKSDSKFCPSCGKESA